MSILRVALVMLGDAMLCVALVLITQIDKLVNQTLYSYGLQFSLDWAQPYWLMVKVCMVSIVAAIFLISVVELPVPAFQEKTEETKVTVGVEEAEEEVEVQPEGMLEPEVQEG